MRGYLDEPAPWVFLADLGDCGVPLVAQDDEAGTPRKKLQDDALHLVVHAVLGGHHDYGQVLVHQGQGAVLHLARQDALAVDQGHLFHLQQGELY